MNEKTPQMYGAIGMIGLGNMGLPMSVNMMKDGFTIVGTARTQKTRDALTAAGGTAVVGAAEVAKRSRYIITALPAIDVFEDIAAELAECCEEGTIVLETGTFPIDVKEKARELLAKRGIILLDAPLSGTGAQAKVKDVVVLGSGDEQAHNEFLPIMRGFSKSQYYLGSFGNGMKLKFIANQLVAIHNLSAAEAVLFGVKMGIDPHLVVKVIGEGAGGSRMLSVRGPVMADRTWERTQISNKVFQKDIALIDEALKEAGCPSPLFMAAKPFYTAAMASGHAEDDTSSVYAVLERMSKPPQQ